MAEFFANLLASLPHTWATVLLAMLPFTEALGAIPVAIRVWHVSPSEAMIFGFIGNCLPFIPLYFGLDRFRAFCAKRLPWLLKPLDASLIRAKNKLGDRYEKYGALGLALFVAIPFPLSGVWTAVLAAVALKIPFRAATIGTFAGLFLSSFIITLATLLAGKVF